MEKRQPVSGRSAASEPHSGHRSRLRERFVRHGLVGMLDYEVLELVLTIIIPRRDVKPLAKRLVAEFGSITAVLEASQERLEAVDGVGPATATGLRIMKALFSYSLEEACRKSANLLDNPDKIYDFVRMKMGARAHECYMMLYLDSKKKLIDFRVIAEGTVDYVYAYIRNSAEYALELHAVAAVIVHNHPSGDCLPSPEDLQTTRDMEASLHTLGVELLDHLIVSREACFSFARHEIVAKKPGYNLEDAKEDGRNQRTEF